MHIEISGAAEHNLKDVDVSIGDGLTVVTGVSGSGKTSLVFDTLYHEARRRFLDIFAPGSNALRMPPANVRSISGLGPAIAVGQNLLNRNPSSTLATASGLHPFLRLLYANFGERPCQRCGTLLEMLSEDAIVERVVGLAGEGPITLLAPLVQRSMGSQRTLLGLLVDEYGADKVVVDGLVWDGQPLDATQAHDIDVVLTPPQPTEGRRLLPASREEKKNHDAGNPFPAGGEGETTEGRRDGVNRAHIRTIVRTIAGLGAHAVIAETEAGRTLWAFRPVCAACGQWFGQVKPTTFHRPCPQCSGEGCPACDGTGLHPLAARVRWQGLRLADLLALSVDAASELFGRVDAPSAAARLISEIARRLDALQSVGLGYIALERSAPTLSRGEAQRVRLAVALSSRLEDMLHVLDEPTIGQHPADVGRLVDAFRQLAGPVVFVEHDRIAAAAADWSIDIGPGAGGEGGRVVFAGTPADLWQADTPTGRFFSLRDRVPSLPPRPEPEAFLLLRGAQARNLRGIDVPVPLGRLTVVTGVSGSGKSTLVEEVLVASLEAGKAVGCQSIDGPAVKPVWVDQSPIGHNPRSNPATYTKLADIIRDVFAAQTGLSPSYFSFNRPEGACPVCEGLGAVEVSMRYMPSTWVTCAACGGQRFSDEVLAQRIDGLSIADFYQLGIREVLEAFEDGFTTKGTKNTKEKLKDFADLPAGRRRTAIHILHALVDVGLGYLPLGQPSPTLSGGEAQRVKLARYLGRPDLHKHLLVLDEPSTGLHPHDLAGLLAVLGRLVHAGATVVVVEHNTDVIRAADWVIDLGPGAGPDGGQLLYAGHPAGLVDAPASVTGQAMREEEEIKPLHFAVERNARSAHRIHPHRPSATSPVVDGGGIIERSEIWVGVPHAAISIRDARANNLKGVDVDFPKGAMTVVTGVSGSGKSSLVIDVLEAEAQRRFLESLSLYERQSTREGPEAPVGSVSGLGVSVSITPTRALYNRRATVGSASEIGHHLAVVFAAMGERACLECGATMQRGAEIQRDDVTKHSFVWRCPQCGATAPVANSRHFSALSYAAACLHCHGVGSMQVPAPEKLIIAPEKPLTAGAMYSPGFFPNGYLGKPFNGGYSLVRALAARYGFDPDTTPWNEMSAEAQQVFLFGSSEVLQVTYENRKGQQTVREQPFPGFYGWIRDWDVGGTYTRTEPCPACGGSRLRPDYLAVTLAGSNVHQMGEMTLVELLDAVEKIDTAGYERHPALGSLDTVRRRLRFLGQVGLGYLNLHRVTATLSAGEAQRIKLAGLLGSGLTSLTVLLDEPSRGMHPSEVEVLLAALAELRDEGNTVIVVEHDPLFMQAADYLIEVGPGAGTRGGEIVAQGPPGEFLRASTTTALWLRGERHIALPRARRSPRGWMSIEGARANNLRCARVRLPLGVLVGVCGVSGSGKSTLLLDTLGRALVPRKQTTSVAYEPVDPGEHDAISGAPARAILLDQSRRGIDSPMTYLNLSKPLVRLFAESEEARALNLDERALTEPCSVCRGRGETHIDMGFLPDVHVPCDACRGTGCAPEAWDVYLRGITLPECSTLTIEKIDELFGADDEALGRTLRTVRAVGLGYLVMRQPGYTLSSGEAQRLKIASELCRKTSPETLYILDEPTVGQSLEDIQVLAGVLHRLVDEGHSVVVIEHHPHVLAACDWLVELGPGGGPDGGRVIAEGTPEEVATGDTPTARYVRDVIRDA